MVTYVATNFWHNDLPHAERTAHGDVKVELSQLPQVLRPILTTEERKSEFSRELNESVQKIMQIQQKLGMKEELKVCCTLSESMLINGIYSDAVNRELDLDLLTLVPNFMKNMFA